MTSVVTSAKKKEAAYRKTPRTYDSDGKDENSLEDFVKPLIGATKDVSKSVRKAAIEQKTGEWIKISEEIRFQLDDDKKRTAELKTL